MPDVLTVMRKEVKELLAMGANLKGGRIGMVIMVGVFGVFLPLQMGREWVTSPLTIAYWTWVPLMLVTSLIADSFAGERERHTLETLLASRLPDRAILFGKAAAAVAYGWSFMLVMLSVSLVTVNVAYGHRRLLLYSWSFTLGALLCGLLTAGLAASAGVLVSLRAATVRQAAQNLSIGIMLCIFVPAFGIPVLPKSWKASLLQIATTLSVAQWIAVIGIALAAIDGVLLLAAIARFKRARLILD